jgi:hypothetical protein
MTLDEMIAQRDALLAARVRGVFIDRIMRNPVRTLPWGVDSLLVKGAARSRGLGSEAWGMNAKSIWTHLDDSASEWWSLWDGVSSHFAAPLRRGFFGRLPLPKLDRSPRSKRKQLLDSEPYGF